MIRGLMVLAGVFMFAVGTLMVLTTGLRNGWWVISAVGACLLAVDLWIEHNEYQRSEMGR